MTLAYQRAQAELSDWRNTRRRSADFLQRVFGSMGPRLGALIVLLILAIGIFGPFVAPHDPAELLTTPYAPPGRHTLLGGDYLGRDALSRFLWGGRSIITMSVISMICVYTFGIAIGLATAYRRGVFDGIVTGLLDLALAFPPLIFVLVLISALGSHLWLVVVGVVVIFTPRVARIVRGAALDVVVQEFVEAAVARGERTRAILLREVLPNLWPSMLADFGVRATWTVILIASLGFLGFGQQPPAADWGSLISENRSGLLVEPWPVLAPLCTLALLTVGINLVADGIIRALTSSGEVDESEARGRLV
jgi:peptide/nickel transport system permease protein